MVTLFTYGGVKIGGSGLHVCMPFTHVSLDLVFPGSGAGDNLLVLATFQSSLFLSSGKKGANSVCMGVPGHRCPGDQAG